MFVYFNHFTIAMTKKQAAACSHPGACDADVAALVGTPAMERQLRRIPDVDLVAELKEYGAWDDLELHNRIQNERRIVWVAAGNIMDEIHESKRGK